MKRPKPFGYVHDEQGNRYPITHAPTAHTLQELSALNQVREERIQKLGSQVSELNLIIGQRNLQLARIQNNWWVRLGEAMHLLRFVEKE